MPSINNSNLKRDVGREMAFMRLICEYVNMEEKNIFINARSGVEQKSSF
jgi:hypothetical protein